MLPTSSSSQRPRLVPADPEIRERDERLESLKAVVGKLAHDFNNFLVPQLGYVTLIKEDLAAGSMSAQYADTLEEAARKTEATLEHILLGMRPHRRFNPRQFDLSSLLLDATNAWERELPKTAQITVLKEIATGCELNGDSDQWVNLFNQLFSNARYALATGGTLEVTLSPEQLSPDKQAALGLSDSKVFKITFKDDGFGMSPAVLKRAFEPFYTSRTQVKVPGIGLTIVHSVTHLHGGQVEVATSDDIGTTLTIYAPVVPIAQLKPSMRTPASKTTLGKILLVEDDPLVREVLRSSLQSHQKEVILAQNGEEGLHAFKKYLGNWDLIVTDVVMPKLNGIELFKAIRALDKEVSIIMVSGDPAAGD
ncbi:MAG: response regulator, partial [Verrucomicrobiales bacterium]